MHHDINALVAMATDPSAFPLPFLNEADVRDTLKAAGHKTYDPRKWSLYMAQLATESQKRKVAAERPPKPAPDPDDPIQFPGCPVCGAERRPATEYEASQFGHTRMFRQKHPWVCKGDPEHPFAHFMRYQMYKAGKARGLRFTLEDYANVHMPTDEELIERQASMEAIPIQSESIFAQ